MKKILMISMTMLLVFTAFLHLHTVFAEEAENYCEDMSFSVETVKAGDDTIEGEADAEDEIELEIGEYRDIVIADNDNSYTFDIEADMLSAGNEIKLVNEQHEIETEAVDEDTETETIESELQGECEVPEEILQDMESEEAEEDTVDEEVEEPSEEAEETTGLQENTDETAAEEDGDEIQNSEENVEEQTSEEESQKEHADGNEEQKSEEQDLGESESGAAQEDDNESTEDEASEENISEDSNDDVAQENADESTETQNDSTDEATEKRDSEEDTEQKIDDEEDREDAQLFSTGELIRQSAAPIEEVQGTTATVGTTEAFNSALYNPEIEVIILDDHINSSGAREVRSDSSQKIIEANGFSIGMRAGNIVINDDINTMIVRNASNLYTTNSLIDGGLFETSNADGILHLENITFNASNFITGGKIASNPPGEVHFYGENTINTRNGSNTLAFRKVVVHDGAALDLNHRSSGGALFFRGGESSSNIEHALDIRNNANVDITSNSAVLTSEFPSGSSDGNLTLSINGGANTVLSGSGANIFQVDTAMEVDINDPQTADFINRSNNRLFSSGIIVSFNVRQVSIHGWGDNSQNELPSHMTPFMENAQFTFENTGGTTVQSMTPPVPNFSDNFIQTMPRMMFAHSEDHVMDLSVNPVNDLSTEITGETLGDATITIYDENDNVIDTTISDDSGNFSFNLEVPFQAGDVLRFQAEHHDHVSEIIEVNVTGDRLEFLYVPDTIPFETTEMHDEETVVDRQNPDLNINILNTKEIGSWQLTAQVHEPLSNDNGATLENAMYFVENGTEYPLEDDAVEVARGNAADIDDTHEISWDSKEGILLKLNPVYANPDTEYSTEVEWVLTDGP